MQTVVSFDFFDEWTIQQNVVLWENFVKDTSVDNAVIWTTLSQLSFGNGSYSLAPTAENTDELFLQSQILVNTDIMSLVTSSQNPDWAISAHVAHTEKTIAQIKDSSDALNASAQDYLTKSKQCLAEKRRWDAMFFKWVQQSDDRVSDEWLALSLEYAPCYITNRIQANAQAFLAQKVQTNAYLLSQRSSLLTQNKDLLVNNSSYLEWTILEDLLAVKYKMTQLNNVSFDKFVPNFNFDSIDLSGWNSGGVSNSSFDYLNFDYQLPKYDSFVIWPDKIPTFQEPWLDNILWS